MPYLSQEDRKALARGSDPVTVGQLNYVISRRCDDFIMAVGLSYDTINEVIGVLACVQQELYRRVAAPYEDQKMQDNGDVFNAVDEVEAMGQLVDPPKEPSVTKPGDRFQLTPDHEAYHIDYEPDDEGNKVAILSANKDCPFCRFTLGAMLNFHNAVAKEKEHGQT